MAEGAALDLDVSDAERLFNELKETLSEKEAALLMSRAVRETGRHVKTILGQDLPKKYDTRSNWVKNQIGKPQMENENSTSVGCIIPVKGVRQIPGAHHKLYSWKKGKSIQVQIVKGTRSTLPAVIPHQGGNPPFVAKGKGTTKKMVFTRTTENRYPIARVPGIGVPQMPMNRSKDEVENDVANFMVGRIIHNYDVIINKLAAKQKL